MLYSWSPKGYSVPKIEEDWEAYLLTLGDKSFLQKKVLGTCFHLWCMNVSFLDFVLIFILLSIVSIFLFLVFALHPPVSHRGLTLPINFGTHHNKRWDTLQKSLSRCYMLTYLAPPIPKNGAISQKRMHHFLHCCFILELSSFGP